MKNIVILISGRGSNMQSIVEACKAEKWDARIVAVLSNNPAATGLEWAAKQGISTGAIDHKKYADRAAFDEALHQLISPYKPDLIVLAGFMRILTAEFVELYEGRMVNIHPSLLPLFPGLNTHQRAIDAGHKKAGVTVHLVTKELDHGPILGQAEVPISKEDTAESLAAKVLVEEHKLYPKAVRTWLENSGR